jgi:hypothetical protein
MELVDRDLKCIFCRAMLVFLVRDQAYLRDQGFKHDLRFCDGCKSRPEWTGTSNLDRPHVG